MGPSFYKISNVNQMEPFLMTITSGEDHWMYLSSTGCLTAGRKKAEHALFPYVTDDILHRNAHFTGPVTVIRINDDDKRILWRPFSLYNEHYEIVQNLYKNNLGNIVIFEEINHSIGLTYIYRWQCSGEYGFIRKSKILNNNAKTLNIQLIDGLRNIMPACVELRTQQEMSNLVNAYKVSEYSSKSNCALFFLSGLLMDRPEPGEALYSNLVWSHYNGKKEISVNEKDAVHFKNTGILKETHHMSGKPGAFLTKIEKDLEPEEKIQWYTIADVYKSQSEIIDIICEQSDRSKIELKLEESLKTSHSALESAIGSADGFQCTNNTINDQHHTANTTFNVLRGGVFLNNYIIIRNDFLLFLKSRNKQIFEQYRDKINSLPDRIEYTDFINFSHQTLDPSIERLSREYLPLTLGRRHGDPSRPWNHFEIRTHDKHGENLFYYEGNWRDIFQNWEALGFSYPLAWEAMVSKFLNATTIDGYNPYRITTDGIDWEVSAPEEPWSFIGYWNDHQIIYLLKLLEHLQNHDPTRIEFLFNEPIFSYANIPYRIRSFNDIVANPKETIDFDIQKNASINKIVSKIGSDGKLFLNKDKTVYHVNLGEKILVLILAKICNLIPGAGIWLNTQRPEWNDANNALVGYGTSMVTVYYMKRYISFINSILQGTNHKSILVSTEITEWIHSVIIIIKDWQKRGDTHITINQKRMEYICQLGTTFSDYRNKVYQNGFSGEKELMIETIFEFFDILIKELDNTIKINQDDNGLFHSYNTIKLDLKNKSADIKNLSTMLEGQVAFLSIKQLEIDKVITLLESLFNSDLYREDQNSFILYPIKEKTLFLEKNIIPSDIISKSDLLIKMLEKKDFCLIEQDAEGSARFRPDFRNIFDLQKTLNNLKQKNEYRDLIKDEKSLVLEIFEGVFNHRSYTGRSGTMYSYEGIGSIYWHMVSKLLLAIQENYFQAIHMKKSPKKIKKLGELYYSVRGGLSAEKTPKEYGAFPYDPYSHNPSHSGAQQPGMTGQVKEEILTRFGELGIIVDQGRIIFEPSLLQQNEFLNEKRVFKYFDVSKQKHQLTIEKDQLAFTFCQVPIIYTLSNFKSRITLEHYDGSKFEIDGNIIDAKNSNTIFNRDNRISLISVLIYTKSLIELS